MSSSARERLYHASLLSTNAQRGTPYPCSQRDINATEQFSHHNERPFVSASRASREIIEHNDQRRSPSSCEQDAIRCLARALDEAESGPWGPDLIIKCFCDLDIVFFGGVLRGNVRVGWGSAHELAMLEEALRDNYGITIHTQPGRADIFLNARGIFSNPNAAVSLFRAIFSTMLHEMCVGTIILYPGNMSICYNECVV